MRRKLFLGRSIKEFFRNRFGDIQSNVAINLLLTLIDPVDNLVLGACLLYAFRVFSGTEARSVVRSITAHDLGGS